MTTPKIFLETSACIIYSLRASYSVRKHGRTTKRTFQDAYNDTLNTFLGFCHEKNLKLITTETVKKEALHKLRSIVRERCFGTGLDSDMVEFKCRLRLQGLFKKVKIMNVSDPKIAELIQLYKTSAMDALPSFTDMKILAEATRIAQKEDILFITNDRHFTELERNIEKSLRVKVIPLSAISLLKKELSCG